MIANTIGADMDAEQLQELYQLARAAHAITDFEIKARALLARQPAAIDNEADDDIEEAREILENMVRSIELDGNYSTEATCTFLRQALNCLPDAAPLDKEASKPAAPSWAPVINRNFLGQVVREAWVKWAKQQPNPKPSWLAPYDELSEADKEADRQIGEAVLQWVLSIKSAIWEVSPSVEQDERGALPLSDFREGQWWISELDAWAETGSADQKRAVAVVHRLLRTASTSANVAQDDDIATLHKLAEHLESGSSSIFSYEAGEKYASLLRGLLARTAPANVAQGAEAVGLVMTNDKGEKYGALLDSNIEERTKLYAAPPAQTALTDDARECLLDVTTHFDNLRAGLCAQRSEATNSDDGDSIAYWNREIRVLERMKAQAERALTASQSASGDTK